MCLLVVVERVPFLLLFDRWLTLMFEFERILYWHRVPDHPLTQ